MMLDWNEYEKQIGATLAELMKLSPDTVRGYHMSSAANAKTGSSKRKLVSLSRSPWPLPDNATDASWFTATPH
jgi:hypothetical protein